MNPSTPAAARPSMTPSQVRRISALTVAAGIVTFQTRLAMPYAEAAAFAHAVETNPAFSGAMVVSTRREGLYRVCYAPVSPDALLSITREMQDRDEARATAQGVAFTFRMTTETGSRATDVYDVEGLTDTYECSENHCTCAHYEFRQKRAGLRCKHMIELSRRLDERDAEIARLREMMAQQIARLDARVGGVAPQAFWARVSEPVSDTAHDFAF